MEPYTACSACGALSNITHYEHVALCPRCSHVIARKPYRFELIIALFFTLLIFTVAAFTLPLVTFTLAGSTNTYTVYSAFIDFYKDGFVLLSGVVLLLTIVIPLLQITLLALTLIPLYARKKVTHFALFFRWLQQLKQWNMIEVFLISIFISMVKLHKDAELHAGVGLYLLTAMILTMIALNMLFKPRDLWRYKQMRMPHA